MLFGFDKPCSIYHGRVHATGKYGYSASGSGRAGNRPDVGQSHRRLALSVESAERRSARQAADQIGRDGIERCPGYVRQPKRQCTGGLFSSAGPIRTFQNNLFHWVAKLITDPGRGRQACLIFDCIVKEGGNRFILIGARFQHDARNGQQMRDIWHLVALTNLRAVKIVCHLQRGIESVRECHRSPVNR